MEEQKMSPVLVHLKPKNSTLDHQEHKNPTLNHQEQKNPSLDHQEQKHPSVDYPEQKSPTLDHQEQKNSTLPVNVDDTFSFSSENESFQHQQDEQESDFEFGSITPGSPTSDSCKNSPADLLFFNGQLLPHVFPAKSKPIVGANKNPTTKKPARLQPYSTIPKSKWQFIKPAPVLTATTDICRNKKIETVAVHQKPKIKKQIKTKKKKSRSVRSWLGWRLFRSIVWACRACHALEP
ncbi:hypothetical protein MKX03_008026 [Papaver bracteatum]|nr:hypothetical protein MKX03_008026 [Papaver bracteatum]